MKINKGKLSTANLVAIGVLVLMLYLVMPTGSKNNKASEHAMTVAEPPEGTSSNPVVPKSSGAIPNQQPTPTSPNSSLETSGVASTTAEVKPLAEIRQQDLEEITGRNPFLTTAVQIPAENDKGQKEPEATTDKTAADDTSATATLLRAPSMKLFYSSSTGRQAAVLNDAVVYPGSSVAACLSVQSIHPDGIKLQQSATVTTMPGLINAVNPRSPHTR